MHLSKPLLILSTATVSVASLVLLARALTFGTTGPTSASPDTPSASSDPRATALAPAPDLDEARALALAPPTGSTAAAQAVRDAQASAQRAPHHPLPWVLLGRAWSVKARADADPGASVHANATADLALNLAPDDALALHLRAMVMLDQHRFGDARDLAHRVTARDPSQVLAWGTLSDALVELGDFEGATEAAQRMVDLKPGLPSYARAAWLRWLGGDVEGARVLWRSAFSAGVGQADLEPATWILSEAADTFWHAGDLDGADAGYQLALARMPDYAAALVGRARVALARGEAAQAASWLGQALKRRPAVETARLLSLAHDAAGRPEAAKAAWEEAERIGRRSDARGLAALWASRGLHPEEALSLARAEQVKRRGVYTEDTLALALLRAGALEEALDASKRALARPTPDARLLYHAGLIHLACGQTTRARDLLKQALTMNPHFDLEGAAEARRLLEADHDRG